MKKITKCKEIANNYDFIKFPNNKFAQSPLLLTFFAIFKFFNKSFSIIVKCYKIKHHRFIPAILANQ